MIGESQSYDVATSAQLECSRAVQDVVLEPLRLDPRLVSASFRLYPGARYAGSVTADWWDSTAGPRFTRVSGAALDHRRFWKAMDRLDEPALVAIETALGRRMVSEFGLDLSGLVLGMTNFATDIDSTNDKAPIAQRGKAKQKRTDLRLVGLALLVTRDGGIPLVSHAYAGDRPDVTQFSTVIAELVNRYRALHAGVQTLTVVSLDRTPQTTP